MAELSKMIDMKQTSKERKEEIKVSSPAKYTPPPYPYGTTIELRDDHVKAFPGLLDCTTDQEVEIRAKAKIISINEWSSDSGNGKQEHCTVEFQLTKISLGYQAPKKAGSISVKSKGSRTEYQAEDF